MKTRSIQFRLTVWYTLIFAAGLGVFSGLIWFSLRQRLLTEMDRDLAARASRFQNYVTKEAAEVPPERLIDEMEEFCQALTPSDYLELRGGGLVFRYPKTGAGSPQGRRTFSSRFNIGRETFELRISSSLQTIEHTLTLLLVLLLGLVPVVIAMAAAGGAWLSRRALKPVDEITTAALTIGIDNLSLRLRTPATGDELQRLTEVWNSMLERLERAVRMLSQFAADASHELRTPLAIIRTGAELALRRARSPEAYRESLVEISDEAERMTRLVDDLLFLARNDAHPAEMPREPLDLNNLLDDVCAELRSMASLREIGLRVSQPSAGDEPVMVRGNRPALRRLFLVLLDNALKYSRPGGEVLAAISMLDGKAVVTVRDFGIGIAPAELPHIFERFYQADKARTDGGFGLGLSLAESIARAHGGTIQVTSEQGRGSTFQVEFSAAQSPPAPLAAGYQQVSQSARV